MGSEVFTMNKIPRFVIEYANYQKKCIKENSFMGEDVKATSYNIIEKSIMNLERGLITIRECMEAIAKQY